LAIGIQATSKLLHFAGQFEVSDLDHTFGKFFENMNTAYQMLRAMLLTGSMLVSVFSVHSQGFLKTDGKKIVNEGGENVLLRGMGLGGWMLQEGYMLKKNEEGQQHKIRGRIEFLVGPERTEEFYNQWLSNHTRKIDIDSLKAWGFNSVRLPMHYNLYTLPVEKEPVAGKNTWLEKGFKMTDDVLAWCRANKMYLILDLHAAPGGQGTDMNISDRDPQKPSLWDSEANRQKTIALWKQIATRYSNEPWIGAYDLINEPNWGFEDYKADPNGLRESRNEPLKKLMVDITNAIREVDKKHIIVIEGNGWGNNYNNMLPPWDNNMVLSYHKYWNYNDDASVAHIIKSRDQYNVPVWLGETGENSNVWYSQAIHLLEKNNIGWAWWPLKKMGSNNPLEVKSNDGYEKILAYWYGKGPKPDPSTAWAGLQQLGEDLKLENNIYHRDVVDAMMRQSHSAQVRPFKNHTLTNTLTIAAVDYNMGRNGKAYYDLDTANYWVSQGPRGGNKGRVYRNDGVDLMQDSLNTSNYFVTDFESGEWLQYTVNTPEAGTCSMELTAYSADAPAVFSIRLNGAAVSSGLTFPAAKGKDWTSLQLKDVRLKQGQNTITVRVESGKAAFKSISLKKQ
jgi:endoglucanase